MRLRNIVVACALALGVIATTQVAGEPPAAAHNVDSYSAWYCASKRPNPPGDHALTHSHVSAIGNGWIQYECHGWSWAWAECDKWWVHVWIDSGATWGPLWQGEC